MASKRKEYKLEDSLKPLMTIGRFMGITFPPRILATRYKLVFIYRTVIFSGLILLFVHEIPTMTFWTRFAKGIHRMLAFLETKLRWFAVFANFVLNGYSNPSVNEVLSTLRKTSLNLSGKDLGSIFRFQLILVFLHLFFLVPYMCLGIDFLWVNPHRTWYTTIIYVGTEFFTGISNLQFVALLFAIKKHFQTLNGILSGCEFETGTRRKREGETTVYYIGRKGLKKEEDVGEIVRFRRIHMTLIDCCLKANACFSLQILLFLILALVEMIYSFRSAVIFFIDPNNDDVNFWRTKYWLESCLIIFWSGYYFWHVFAVITACEAIFLEAINTAALVNELINKVDDTELRKQLQIFSLQLTNHQIYLYAGKFVVLNYPLLNSIVGTVITYLVIITTFKSQ